MNFADALIKNFDSPKSIKIIDSFAELHIMFSGLMSRWIIFRERSFFKV